MMRIRLATFAGLALLASFLTVILGHYLILSNTSFQDHEKTQRKALHTVDHTVAQKTPVQPKPSLQDYVRFTLQESSHIVEDLLTDLVQSRDKKVVKSHEPRNKPSRQMDLSKFCWLDNPLCQAAAEIPEVTQAARRLSNLPDDAMLFHFTTKIIRKKPGDQHNLHTDMEFAHPDCFGKGGVTVWILLDRQCDAQGNSSSQTPVSPLTLLSASHKLNYTAQDEIQRQRPCHSFRNHKTKESSCDVDSLLQRVVDQHRTFVPQLQVVQGPTKVGQGIVWPSTAWHMTDDTGCSRTALILQYATSLKCARSLQVGGDIERIRNDRIPFEVVGGPRLPSPEDAAFVDDPMDRLHLSPRTRIALAAHATKRGGRDQGNGPANECTILNLPIPSAEKAEYINDTWVSGEFQLGGSLNSGPAYKFKVPSANWVKTDHLALTGRRTVYLAHKADRLAHLPHIEPVEELCVVLKGRINYATGARQNCSDTFHVMAQKRGDVTILFPGIAHTNSGSPQEDSEHLCLKFFPYKNRTRGYFPPLESILKASIAASRGSNLADVDQVMNAHPARREAVSLFHFRNGMETISGMKDVVPSDYNKLHVKLVHYPPNSPIQPHRDRKYELVAVVLEGQLEIWREEGRAPVLVPKHQVAVVPAGAMHGCRAGKEPTTVMLVEIGIDF